jgi:acetylglutamate kinase
MKLVIKIGGAALDQAELRRGCAHAIAELAREHQVAVVHGGGAALTRLLAQLGKKSEFVGGLRVTDSEARDAALMVLAGLLNKQLVAELSAHGCTAVGLCGGDGNAFRAKQKCADLGFVGEICAADSSWIEAIWAKGAVPVISSLALGFDGIYYNVNADQMASACAIACGADALLFLTDVPGVKDASGSVMRWLPEATIASLTAESVISGGMLPKLEACRQALHRGVARVLITPAAEAAVLARFGSEPLALGTEVVA